MRRPVDHAARIECVRLGLTAAEAAARLNCTPSALYGWAIRLNYAFAPQPRPRHPRQHRTPAR